MPTVASPPKRLTRAQAKAAEEKKEAMKSVKVTTASARAALKPTKARAEKADQPDFDENAAAKKTAAPRKLTSKAAEGATAETKSSALKSRTATKPTRGRPKKAETLETQEETKSHEEKPARPATRTRAGSIKASTTAKPVSKTTTRKKVTFDENEDDKENVIQVAQVKKSTTTTRKATVAERPVRKSAATAPTRSTRAKAVSKPQAPSPLSPKKETQVARVKPVESDDELSGAKTPLKILAKSPVKSSLPIMSPAKFTQTLKSPTRNNITAYVDELQAPGVAQMSPVKVFQGSLASPARRPPTSPFKDAIKSSPKRLADGTIDMEEAMKSSVLMKSPIKFALGEQVKPLGQEGPPSALKRSLLLSPARRPNTPAKYFAASTAGEASVVSPQRRLLSPPKEFMASLLAVKSCAAGPTMPVMVAADEMVLDTPKAATLLAPPVFESSPVHPETECSAPAETTVELSTMTPPGLPTPAHTKAFDIRTPGVHSSTVEDSEDELQSAGKRFSFGTPTPAQVLKTPRAAVTPGPMTALAQRFSAWQGATPDDKVVEQRKTERTVFLPLNLAAASQELDSSDVTMNDVDAFSAFDEAMSIREEFFGQENAPEVQPEVAPEAAAENTFRQSVASDASQEYGDENAKPLEEAMIQHTIEQPSTCTPARTVNARAQVVHTVSKVPLKPADDVDSPLRIKPIRRSKSLTGVLTPRADLEVEGLRQMNPRYEQRAVTAGSLATPQKSATDSVRQPWSAAATPSRTPRADLSTQLLRGAVVFVDVHTTEGADASGVFVELLSQMGAKCVKSWNWNPRASINAPNTDGQENTRIGITHVVFKDGGKRTMEKVRQAKGVVLCVGVGWVLDCERENKWMDETEYTIDNSTIPRGGHRRRKSMEPKRLSSFNGSLFAEPSSKSSISPSKEFLNLNTPRSRRETLAAIVATPTPVPVTMPTTAPARRVEFSAHIEAGPDALSPVSTPSQSPMLSIPSHLSSTRDTAPTSHNNLSTPVRISTDEGLSIMGSPTTPYFLHADKLIQQTCPPKQSQQPLFFPLSGNIADQPDETLRRRLQEARRRSLQFAPRVGSALRGNGEE